MKNYRYIAIAIIAGLFTASCTKNAEIETPASPVLTKATFEASVDGSVKLSLDGVTPSWENGDQIGIFQYGYYENTTAGGKKLRDATKNLFTTTGGTTFTGSIANYYVKGEGGCGNSFYAIYPAASCTKYAVATTTSTLNVASEQTGLLADVGKHLMFKGSLSDNDENVKFEGGVITFLNPFVLKCCTPLLKFTVPAELGATEIILTAKNDTTDAVSLAGAYVSRLTSGTGNWVVPNSSEIKISREGGVISGDVYIVLAPDTNPGTGVYLSSAKTLCFALKNASNWTANLKVNLKTQAQSGNLKKLGTFPSSVTWQKPAGPGLSSIYTSIITEKTAAPYKGIFVSTVNPASTVYYSTCEYTGDTTVISSLAEPSIAFADSILTDNGETAYAANFTKFKVSTPNYSDYFVRAITWKLNKNVGFGKDLYDNRGSLSPAVGDTYPSTGYLYGMQFAFTNIGSTDKHPNINSDCFWARNSKSTYSYGSLSFVVPESGKAKIYFDLSAMGSSGTKLAIYKNGVAAYTIEGISNTDPGHYETAEITVSKNDVIKMNVPSKSLGIYAITLAWVPSSDL